MAIDTYLFSSVVGLHGPVAKCTSQDTWVVDEQTSKHSKLNTMRVLNIYLIICITYKYHCWPIKSMYVHTKFPST